jgi:hypothetical protein
MPALLVRNTGKRSGVLIHPGHPPNLYLSSIGCLNPTRGLLSWQSMDFWDSRARVIALIDDLRRFAPDAFKMDENTEVADASIVVDGEPSNVISSPDGALVAMTRPSSDFATQLSDGPALAMEDIVAPGVSNSSQTGTDAASTSQAQLTFADALKAALEQIEAKKEAKLPDGKSFFFPDGIKSFEIAVTVGSGNAVTLKINEGS